MGDLVVIVPTLNRSHLLEPLAQEFASTSPPHRIVFVVDPDDRESKQVASRVGDVLFHGGGYAPKINAGIRATNEPVILPASDDVKPHPGWFDKAAPLLSDTIGFVSLNDLGNKAVMRGRLATFPLVARWYVEKYGDLFHEGYRHNYVDVEATELAKQRGAFAYCPDAVIEHMHPLWRKGEMDAVYQKGAFNTEAMEHDRALYKTRRSLWV